jgi:hypothetical protein
MPAEPSACETAAALTNWGLAPTTVSTFIGATDLLKWLPHNLADAGERCRPN